MLQALIDANIDIDIYSAAYKGIPLATAMGAALYNTHQQDYPIAYTEKAKDHGEGCTGGSALKGKVAIIDDVLQPAPPSKSLT